MKLIAVFVSFFIAGSALAQSGGTVTNHAVPIGKGPGVTGFTSVVPGALGGVFNSTGASTDPSFYTGTTATPYPLNYSSSTFTGAGLVPTGPFAAFLNQNNVWNTTGVYPVIFNSSSPWAQGFFKSCIGTLTNTTGSGTCTPASAIGSTYGVNITGYAGAPGIISVTAATTNAGTTAAALCAAVNAGTLNNQIYCDPNAYGGAGYFNIAWSLLNSGTSIVATGTGVLTLTNPASKGNEDLVAYQFNHTIPGYVQQAGDGPYCFQMFSQQSPITQFCGLIDAVSPLSAETSFASIVANVQTTVLRIGNGLILNSPTTGGAGINFPGVGFINTSSDGGYCVFNSYCWTKSGTNSLFSTGVTTDTFEFTNSANTVRFGIDVVPTGTFDVGGTISSFAGGTVPTLNASAVSIIGGGSNAIDSFNWGAGTWQNLAISSLVLSIKPSQSISTGWDFLANVLRPTTDNATTLGDASHNISTVFTKAISGLTTPLSVPQGGTGAASFGSTAVIVGGGSGALVASGCTVSALNSLVCGSTTAFNPAMDIANSTNDANPAILFWDKSRAGGNTNSGDTLGWLIARGFASAAAQNTAQIAFKQTAASVGVNIPSSVALSTSNTAGLLNQTLTFDQNAHVSAVQATAPTLTAGCNGAGSVVSGTDLYGTITGQTAVATTCTLTFGTAYAAAPACVATGLTSPLTGAVTPATGTLVVNFASTANYKFTYTCHGA